MVRAWRGRLVVLLPPYRTPAPLVSVERGARLPLGSLVFADGDATIAGLAALTSLSYRAPWAVPCLALPARQEPLEPLLLLVTELRDRLVVVHRSATRSIDDWAQVVKQVRCRAVPTPATLARWVARRLRQRDLEVPLRYQFAEALYGTPADVGLSVASYSRLFAHYGSFTARDWRALGRLAAHAASGLPGERRTSGQTSLRTTCEYARRYLGVPYHVLRERLGWEWVLEGALRTGRYVPGASEHAAQTRLEPRPMRSPSPPAVPQGGAPAVTSGTPLA